ncbi:MAG: D-alanyl-D-alanine carboxypeptidase/D-alanyl-D-alanine-endopeptidase [Bacteroidota bacterium]
MYRRLFCLLALLVAPFTYAQLTADLDATLDNADTGNAFWGALVIDLDSGRTLYSRNASKSFTPASNMKLYTTAAGLDQLGPDFSYKTRVYVDGEVENGVLHGNVIVRGSGDPTISGRFNDDDRTRTFRDWAGWLKGAGIRHITGDLIGDDDVFDDVALGYGWSWDDLPYWYAAELGGLVFNDNCVDFEIKATEPGQPATVSWEPHNTDYVQVVNATRTIPGGRIDEGYERTPGSNKIRLSSLVPAGRTDKESLTVANPTQYFMHVFRETLVREGIVVEGRAVDVDDLSIKPDYQRAEQIAVYTSPPLAELAKVVNKRSHNLFADQLLKTIAVEAYPDSAGSHELGIEAAMRTFATAGVDTSRIVMADGSGLSHINLVTPEMTVALLEYMAGTTDATFDAFYESLPIAGVDGSLEYRMRRGPARGNARAKTGYISGARTLSGYVTTRSGRRLAFSLMCNHYTIKTREVNQIQDDFVTRLAMIR